ncbi:MAG: hypothetical protein KJ936_00990 [Proteobacteria bacterium]|nr:hypothetical protein [Pseudomonadota bacterium]MBU2226243.1 hypothetical protein [Pseudomonadota bacterium]
MMLTLIFFLLVYFHNLTAEKTAVVFFPEEAKSAYPVAFPAISSLPDYSSVF